MHSLGVERHGIKIMSPKTKLRVIHLSRISSFSANILKQQILSLGGDLALPREALVKRTLINSILFATDSQIERLLRKIRHQSSSLRNIGSLIRKVLDNFQREKFILKTTKRALVVSKPVIMGIINVTPDSFSGDGLLTNSKVSFSSLNFNQIIKKKVEEIVKKGVDLIDIGGESTRPGAKPIKAKEELKRILPVIKFIKRKYPKILLSVDTYKPQVAKLALKEGAEIVNDITGLRNPKMMEVVKKEKAAVVIMHMKGRPLTMQKNPFYKDVIEEIYNFLAEATEKALKFGIEKERIIIDVGIGFGKRLEDNLKLIKYLYQFKSLGYPILIGTSRKSFIGKVLKKENPQERILGTVISLVISIINGAKILRVHDISQAQEAIKLTQTIFSRC